MREAYIHKYFDYLMIGKIYLKRDIQNNGGTIALRPMRSKQYICELNGNVYRMEEWETLYSFKCMEVIITKHDIIK